MKHSNPSHASSPLRRLLLKSATTHLGVAGAVYRLLPGAALAASIGAAVAHRSAQAAQVATETREVSGFDSVVFAATGELYVTQGSREHLSIEAEPEVLRKITAEVRSSRLTLGFAPGNVISREPIRFRLELKSLRMLDVQSSGTVQLNPLKVEQLALLISGSGDIDAKRVTGRAIELRLSGSGNIVVAGGEVDAERIEIGGAGSVATTGLASRSAEVSIGGSGDVQLSVADRLAVRISGSGSVRYRGNPQLDSSVTGAGTVEQGG